MKGQRYCGSIKDIKMVCPECSEKYFFPIANYNERMLDALKENGPIRISCPWCYNNLSGGTVVDLDNPKDWYGDPNTKSQRTCKPFADVMYFEQMRGMAKKFEAEVVEKFPSARIGDASDYIHGKRVTVDLAGEFRDDYTTWIVMNDYGGYSFLINLIIQSTRLPKTEFSLAANFEEDIATIKKAIELKNGAQHG